MDFEESKGEEVLYSNTQTAPSESEFENVLNGIFDTGEWSSERQRPTQATRRPTRLRDSEFETQFRPEERKRKCNKLGRGDQARSDIDNVCNFNKHVKKANVRLRLGRGVKQKLVRRIHLPTESRPISPDQRGDTTQRLSPRADRRAER